MWRTQASGAYVLLPPCHWPFQTVPSCAEHHKHAQKGMFLLFGTTPSVHIMLNSKSMPIWACFGCSAQPLPFPFHHYHPPTTKHKKHALEGMYFMFGTLLTSLLISNTRTSPHGHVLLFGYLPPILNIRTRPQGCVLMFGHILSSLKQHFPFSLLFCCSGTSSPCGLILVFGHVPSPFSHLKHQNASLWACSYVWSCPPHLQQQKNALSGMFFLSNPHTPSCAFQHAPTLPLISKTSDPPR